MAKGRTPHFARLAAAGSFSPLATSAPPQSPVAWSSFITGTDPGHHGIFDFVHRDPQTMTPYLSTTRVEPARRTLRIGSWQLPLSGASISLLRSGQPFWDVLEAHGVETTIVRMPANFPPSGTATRELSGMGTPDILGTYGTFSYFTSNPYAIVGKTFTAGIGKEVDVAGGVVHAALIGPDNPLRRASAKRTVSFSVHLDPAGPFGKLSVGYEGRLPREGEWSGWGPNHFQMLPLQHLPAMARFYLKQVRPHFELYVSPL